MDARARALMRVYMQGGFVVSVCACMCALGASCGKPQAAEVQQLLEQGLCELAWMHEPTCAHAHTHAPTGSPWAPEAAEKQGLLERGVEAGEGAKEPAVEQADAARTAMPKADAWYLRRQAGIFAKEELVGCVFWSKWQGAKEKGGLKGGGEGMGGQGEGAQGGWVVPCA